VRLRGIHKLTKGLAMKKHKIPIKEATGEKNLSGNYQITFNLSNISDKDGVIITDIIEGLARTFEHSNALPKIAKIDIEKLDVNGTPYSETPIKVGDHVKLNKQVTVVTTINKDNEIYVIGSSSGEQVAEVEAHLPEESEAIVNAIHNDEVELIDFSSALSVTLSDNETGDEDEIIVNVDAVKVKLEDLDKIGE
jgi:hypothetical protein